MINIYLPIHCNKYFQDVIVKPALLSDERKKSKRKSTCPSFRRKKEIQEEMDFHWENITMEFQLQFYELQFMIYCSEESIHKYVRIMYHSKYYNENIVHNCNSVQRFCKQEQRSNRQSLHKICTREIPYTKAPPLCQWTNTLAYYTWFRLALNMMLSDGNFKFCGINSITGTNQKFMNK